MAKETAGDKKDNADWSQIVASKLLWQAFASPDTRVALTRLRLRDADRFA